MLSVKDIYPLHRLYSVEKEASSRGWQFSICSDLNLAVFTDLALLVSCWCFGKKLVWVMMSGMVNLLKVYWQVWMLCECCFTPQQYFRFIAAVYKYLISYLGSYKSTYQARNLHYMQPPRSYIVTIRSSLWSNLMTTIHTLWPSNPHYGHLMTICHTLWPSDPYYGPNFCQPVIHCDHLILIMIQTYDNQSYIVTIRSSLWSNHVS